MVGFEYTKFLIKSNLKVQYLFTQTYVQIGVIQFNTARVPRSLYVFM